MAGSGKRWVIILSGGEGERMQPHIKRWLGIDRPKQYCRWWAGQGESSDATYLRMVSAHGLWIASLPDLEAVQPVRLLYTRER